MKYFILIVVLLLATPLAYAHHKDDHDKGGKPDDKGKPDDVPKGKGLDKDKQSLSGSSGCSRMLITNNASTYARCTVIDIANPSMLQYIVTPSGYYCVNAVDDVGIKLVLINGIILDKWSGSYSWYCMLMQEPVWSIIIIDKALNVYHKEIY